MHAATLYQRQTTERRIQAGLEVRMNVRGLVRSVVMRLPDHISKLVDVFRRDESADARGPRFTAVAYALEEEMRTGVSVSTEMLLSCFGPPDRFDDRLWLYVFDHEEAGLNNDEWYFFVEDGHVAESAFNIAGVNDVSGLSNQSDFQGGSR